MSLSCAGQPIPEKDASVACTIEGCEWTLKGVLLVTLCILSLAAGIDNVAAAPFFTETNKQAVFLSPLEEWRPTWHLEEYVSLLEKSGYHVDVLLNENVSISFLKTGLANYDIIILRTDSMNYKGFNYYCSGEPVSFQARRNFAGEISTNEIHVGACVGFSLNFIKNNYPSGSLRAGLVYVIDGFSEDLASTFVAAGATAYVGYYDAYPLGWGRVDALSIKLLSYLSQGYTVKDAVVRLYLYLRTGHGETASWPSVYYYGDTQFKI